MPTLHLLALVVGASIGTLLTKTSFCYASTLTDVYLFRASRTGAGVVVATLLTLVSFSVFFWLRGPTGFWTPSWGLFSLVGGFVFGVGMVTAGACVTSTLFRVGTGKVRYLITLLFMGVGYVTYGTFYIAFRDRDFTPLWLGPGGTLFEYAPVPAPLLALGIAAVVVLVYATSVGRIESRFDRQRTGQQSTRRHLHEGCAVLRSRCNRYLTSTVRPGSIRRRLSRPWRPVTAGIGIAGLASLWLWVHRAWTVSGPESQWVLLLFTRTGITPGSLSRWTTALSPAGAPVVTPDMVLIGGILVGSLLTSLLDGSFRLQWPEPSVLPYAAGGGLLMGIGSRIAPGCNIANLLTGLAELSVHSIVASAGILGGAYVATRWFY